MKKISAILTATALSVVAAQSQAALFNVSASGSTSIVGAASGSSNGSGVGILDTDTGILTFSLSSTSLTEFGAVGSGAIATDLDLEIDYSFDLGAVSGTSTATSCLQNGGLVANACNNVAIGVASDAGLTALNGSYAAIGDAFSLDGVTTAGGGAVTNTAVYSFTVDSAVSEVPVPAAAWLFGSALLGLAGVGRKRKVA